MIVKYLGCKFDSPFFADSVTHALAKRRPKDDRNPPDGTSLQSSRQIGRQYGLADMTVTLE